MKPTILEITRVDVEDDSIDYDIIEDHSGGWYEACPKDVPNDITEEEEDQGKLYRGESLWKKLDGEWFEYKGDNSASRYDPWTISTEDAIYEMGLEKLTAGQHLYVYTDYCGDGWYDNEVTTAPH